MPMILLTVPPDASAVQCEQVAERLTDALREAGVEGGITVWPVVLAAMVASRGRLLLEYKSRQTVVAPHTLAQIMAETVEKVFDRQVEAAVMKLDSTTTGLHITPER